MHEDMRALLNSYLDDELRGVRLRELELHLASCESCQNELRELRQVSDLLQAAPTPEFMPSERFVSNLMLRLPRRNMSELTVKPGSLAWWLVPTGLLGSWFFVQTVFLLTDLVSAAKTAGLLGQAAPQLGASQQTIWFSAIFSLFGGLAGGAQSVLSLLNGVNLLGTHLLEGFLWQALIVLLYWGWLFAMWLYRYPRSVRVEKAS